MALSNFRSWLLHEMRVGPHMPVKYYQKKYEDIKAIEDRLLDFPVFLEESLEFIYDWTGDSDIRYLRVPHDISNRLPHTGQDKYTLQQTFSGAIKSMLDYWEYDNPHGWKNFLKQVVPIHDGSIRKMIFEYKDHYFEPVKKFIQRLPELKELLKTDADYLKGGSQYDPSDNWPTYQEAVQILDRIVQGFNDIRLLIVELQDLETKTKAWMDNMNWAANADSGGPKLPEYLKPVEVMYHATVATPKIVGGKIKSREELGGSGKLGGGPSDVISFTADLDIAVAIANVLISAVKISKGEITLEELFKRAEAKGIDLSDTEPWREKEHGSKKDDRQIAFELLRYYIAKAQEKGILYNPFFSSVTFEDFLSVDENDIGVVACRVKTDKITEYLPSLQEFRVPSQGVIRCRKINVKIGSVI